MQFGLIGDKLISSFSKDIHEMFGAYSYSLCELKEDELEAFIRSGNFMGLNVTKPYKTKVMEFIECDAIAKRVGAVNTIYSKDAKLIGTNTDVYGFMYLLSFAEVDISNSKVLVLGSGGACKAVRCVLEECECDIYVASRNPVKFEDARDNIKYVGYDNLPKHVDYIVNTTPAYNYPPLAEKLLELSQFSDVKGVIDLNYNPYRTKLVIDAQKAGIKAMSGLMMLVAQATMAAKHFIGADYTGYNKDVFLALRREKSNIVLIGMSGSGKSSVAMKIAELTNREYIDIDKEIEIKCGMSVAKIFKAYGEAYFREIERDMIRRASEKYGCVVATGGGSVLVDEESSELLKANGFIVEIRREMKNLAREGRPLVEAMNDEEFRLFVQKRNNAYEKVRDDVVVNKEGLEFIHQAAVEVILASETFFKSA